MIMAKARMLGQKTTYIPNNRDDMRFRKKLARNKELKPVAERKDKGGEGAES